MLHRFYAKLLEEAADSAESDVDSRLPRVALVLAVQTIEGDRAVLVLYQSLQALPIRHVQGVLPSQTEAEAAGYEWRVSCKPGSRVG